MRPIIIGFGLLILCLLILFRIGEVNFIKGDVKLEVTFSSWVYILITIHKKKLSNPGLQQQTGMILQLVLWTTNK